LLRCSLVVAAVAFVIFATLSSATLKCVQEFIIHLLEDSIIHMYNCFC